MNKENSKVDHTNNIIVDDNLMVKYLAGEATPEEAMALHDWLADVGNREYFDQLSATWAAIRPGPKALVDRRAAWNKVHPELKPVKQVAWVQVLKIVAAVLFVAVGGYLIYPSQEQELVTVVTEKQREVELPDHSTIVMYDHTSITYPQTFDGDKREVGMTSGEAYFSVQPDKQKPFVIHTSEADIRVVGTRFNVVSGDEKLEVSVTEGRVMVYNDQDSSMLEAGFTGVVRKGQPIRVTPTEDPNRWAYATKKLIFREVRLEDAIGSIEKSYHCTIEAGNVEINDCKITASFELDSAENVVNLIAESLNLSVTRNGTVFKLDGQGCR